jgi:hypothetical protein
MLAAIFKASYNSSEDTNLVGGICGTAFFIDERNALTVNHLLNLNEFKPNNGFLYCKFWLLLENGQNLVIEKDYLKSFPDIDTTKISFPTIAYKNLLNYKTSIAKAGDKFILKGFLASVPENPSPQATMDWNEQGELIVDNFKLDSIISTQEGVVKEAKCISLNAPDVKINNKKYLTLSCGGNVGLSGAPLIKLDTGEIIGLMSWGLPEDTAQKSKLFAISMDEVEKEIRI